jgi:hypothetical protein
LRDLACKVDATHDVQLELTARLHNVSNEEHNQADVRVSVNGQGVGVVQVGTTWRCNTLNLGREKLRAGANRVTIGWPDVSLDGDRATTHIGDRLKRGVPTNLEPVFGEIQSLVVRS